MENKTILELNQYFNAFDCITGHIMHGNSTELMAFMKIILCSVRWKKIETMNIELLFCQYTLKDETYYLFKTDCNDLNHVIFSIKIANNLVRLSECFELLFILVSWISRNKRTSNSTISDSMSGTNLMHDSSKFSLRLPQRVNSDSFKSELIAEEKLKFHDGKFMGGKGDVFYLNIFYQLNIKFPSCQNIDFEGMDGKDGEHTASGSISGVYCWNPIIMRYRINAVKSPLIVLYKNGALKISSNNPSLPLVSLKAHIFSSNQVLKSHPVLHPKNLSQRIEFIENDQIKWEIDSVYYGGEYSITFGKCNDCFKINRIELSYNVLDSLLSGFEIDKCELKPNNSSNTSEVINMPIKIQSKLEETYFLDF